MDKSRFQSRTQGAIVFVALLTTAILFTNCGGGTSSASGPGSGGPGQPVSHFGAGTGASGQTAAAKFLYATVAPSGTPNALITHSDGTLTLQGPGMVNSGGAQTMAIDPTGTFFYETSVFASQISGPTIPGGIWAFTINRSDGLLTAGAGSPYLSNLNFYSDVIDQKGKFLYAHGPLGVYAFSIQSGTGELTQIAGSPFASAGPFVLSATQPVNRMAIDQTNHFLYVSTTAGIAGFSVNQSTGELSSLAGSPFGSNVTNPAAIVITPDNQFLYETGTPPGNNFANDGNLYGYGLNKTTGALTPLSGSPFGVGQCGGGSAQGVPGKGGAPDNMTIASQSKFLYLSHCGTYSINATTGALMQVSSVVPGDWPVMDPTGNLLWAITVQPGCQMSCNVGVSAYQVDQNTGDLTAVPNSMVVLANYQFGTVESLAITK